MKKASPGRRTQIRAPKKFVKLLKSEGFGIKSEGGHLTIYRLSDNQAIYHTGGTPSSFYSYENALRDMVKLGHLPDRYKHAQIR